jgi:hypothetical protein
MILEVLSILQNRIQLNIEVVQDFTYNASNLHVRRYRKHQFPVKWTTHDIVNKDKCNLAFWSKGYLLILNQYDYSRKN